MIAHVAEEQRDTLTAMGFAFGKLAHQAKPGLETGSFPKALADAELGPGTLAFASGWHWITGSLQVIGREGKKKCCFLSGNLFLKKNISMKTISSLKKSLIQKDMSTKCNV